MPDIDQKTKIILFLGAGASAALEVPTSQQFLNFLRDKHGWNSQSLCTICADYLRSNGKGKFTPGDIDAEDLRDWLVNIEDRLKDLVSLHKAGGPFGVSPRANVMGNPTQALGYVTEILKSFDEIVRKTFGEVDPDRAYRHYHALLRELWKVGLSILPIFTTNYDQVLEVYAENPRSSVNFVDGFSRGHSGAGQLKLDTKLFETLKNDKNTVLYFKLHGSTTWFKHENENKVISLPFNSNPPPSYNNLLIYPTKNKAKLLGNYPFNEYYRYLDQYLKNEAVTLCIVIGYSFGDPEINELFNIAVARGMRLLIIDKNPTPANLTKKIGLPSNQYTSCNAPFAMQSWESHIAPALDKELKLLS